MTTKICSSCKVEKPETSEFFETRKMRNGTKKLRNQCRDCRKIQWDIYSAKYYQENKERIRERHRNYDNKYSNLQKERKKKYAKNNREKILAKQRKYQKERRKTSVVYKLRKDISSSIARNLKSRGKSKENKGCWQFLLYSKEELKQHIESQFEPWMNWDNHGIYNSKTWDDNDSSTWTWQIDHIIPHSEFNYTSIEDESFQQCWALSNLRPLPAKQNILDGTRKTRHNKNNLNKH